MVKNFMLNKYYHDGYAKLAAAILKSGVKNNDMVFLESEWADTLLEICCYDSDKYNKRNTKYTY